MPDHHPDSPDPALASLIADAIEQVDELPDLDAVRAEVWAADLVALAAEIDPEGPAAVVEALAVAGGSGPAAGLWAIDAVSDLVDLLDRICDQGGEGGVRGVGVMVRHGRLSLPVASRGGRGGRRVQPCPNCPRSRRSVDNSNQS